MSVPNKIRATHLDRTAIVYVRQSSPAQVRDNPESRARQYALVEEAAQLGWPASKIEVIDADLGISGRSAERRSGFREVVSRVCLGEVGAILGLEVSRLARSNADFARLLELARLTDTLVIDTDGMYDLREFNDRLLLGLKRGYVGGRTPHPRRPVAGRQTRRSRTRGPTVSFARRLCARCRWPHDHRP
jgi:Resolvase, N terminal domain